MAEIDKNVFKLANWIVYHWEKENGCKDFDKLYNSLENFKESESTLETTMLKVRIEQLEKTLKFAQIVVSTQARNALTELEDGDEQACIDILKSISGDG